MKSFHEIFEPRQTGIETIDDVPTVLVETTPNGISRHFRTNELLTVTPHVEIMGRDLTAHVGKGPIDKPTKMLLETIRSLSNDVKSVSIEPYQVSVDGPHTVNEHHLIRGAWPKHLETSIILCIAQHLGCENGVHIERRSISEAELWERIEAIRIFSSYFLGRR